MINAIVFYAFGCMWSR